MGILPQSKRIRTVILPGYADIVGEAVLETIDDFGVAPVDVVSFPGLTPSATMSDGLGEEFLVGGDHALSFEDTSFSAIALLADWGGGALTSVDGFVLSQPTLEPLITSASLPSDDIYLRNPALFKSCVVELASGPSVQRFDVTGATYDAAAVELRVTVDPGGPDPPEISLEFLRMPFAF